ncbi:MAG: hypothetical protein ABI068_11420, partial [Ktedonobacterales bacterium]
GTQQGVYLSTNGGDSWRVPATGLAQPALAVIASPSKHSSYVLFAAMGQIARFPPAVGVTSPFGQIVPILLVVLLLGMCFYFFYIRQRRYSALLAQQERTGPPNAEGGQRFVYVPLYGPDARGSKAPTGASDTRDRSDDAEQAAYPGDASGGTPGSLATSAKRLVSSTATNTRKMRGADKAAKSNKVPTPPNSSASDVGGDIANTANTANNANARRNNGKSIGKSGGKRPNTGRRS